MAKVIAPNKQYTGLSATVMFVNGIGETDNENLLQWFEEKGYTVERSELEQDLNSLGNQVPDIQIEEMTVPQLKEYAKANDIDLGEAKKKEDILATIQNAHQSIEE